MIPKFRAWSIEHGYMGRVQSIDYRYKQVDLYAADTLNFDEVVLMQSTGLKDGFGTEIFEGDILTDGKSQVGQVIYLPQEAGWVVKTRHSDYRLGHRNTGESYHIANNHAVIGNIFEDEELLQEEVK